MFAAPPAVTAEVFCRIPDKFRRFGETTEWAQVQLHGAAAPVFLEGPVFDAYGLPPIQTRGAGESLYV